MTQEALELQHKTSTVVGLLFGLPESYFKKLNTEYWFKKQFST